MAEGDVCQRRGRFKLRLFLVFFLDFITTFFVFRAAFAFRLRLAGVGLISSSAANSSTPSCEPVAATLAACELTPSIVPRGTSFHRSVELECSPIVIDPAWRLCRRDLPGPTELSAINPYAVHDHGQSARQGHNRLLHSATPGDLHRPGLEP